MSASNFRETYSSKDSRIRHKNYTQKLEDGVNNQIKLELHASYVYMAMSYNFDRDDVALKNTSEYFKKASDEERGHASLLMKFQNQRGGRIQFFNIQAPANTQWASIGEAMLEALDLEKEVNQSLLDLHAAAEEANDPQMADFLEAHYLTEQVEAIKELSDHVRNAERAGPGLGEFMFDKEFSS